MKKRCTVHFSGNLIMDSFYTLVIQRKRWESIVFISDPLLLFASQVYSSTVYVSGHFARQIVCMLESGYSTMRLNL